MRAQHRRRPTRCIRRSTTCSCKTEILQGVSGDSRHAPSASGRRRAAGSCISRSRVREQARCATPAETSLETDRVSLLRRGCARERSGRATARGCAVEHGRRRARSGRLIRHRVSVPAKQRHRRLRHRRRCQPGEAVLALVDKYRDRRARRPRAGDRTDTTTACCSARSTSPNAKRSSFTARFGDPLRRSGAARAGRRDRQQPLEPGRPVGARHFRRPASIALVLIEDVDKLVLVRQASRRAALLPATRCPKFDLDRAQREQRRRRQGERSM